MGGASGFWPGTGGFATGRAVALAALAFVAGLLAGEYLRAREASAEASSGPVREAAGVIAVPGQIGRDAFGLYLVDLRNDTICVYQYFGGNERRLRLMAARTFLYDCQLDSFSTEPPPEDIRQLVEQGRRLKDATTRP